MSFICSATSRRRSWVYWTDCLVRCSVARAVEGKHKSPRFEVPVTAGAAGSGKVEGKLTFFVCTEKICSRQQRDVSVPVEVK